MVQTAITDEPALIERARVDSAAFGELYDRYADQVYRFAYSRLRNRADAEDLTSEVFLKAMHGIKAYRHTGRAFSAWLYRIALNAHADRYRSQRPMDSLDEQADLASYGKSVIDQVVRRVQVRTVWTAVNRLPRQQRTAMILRFRDDLPLSTIAEIMGKSAPAVKLLLFRGVHSLRRRLPRTEFQLTVD